MFIDTSEVAAYWQITDSAAIQPHIDTAEILIAEALGCETLEERDVTLTHYPPVDKQLIELSDGPLVSLLAVTVDGELIDLTDEDEFIEARPWFVRRRAGFAKDAHVVLEYTAGYAPGDSAGESNLPDALRKAIIIAAGERYTQPDPRKTSERIGDYAYTTATPNPQEVQPELSATVKGLIRRYRRP